MLKTQEIKRVIAVGNSNLIITHFKFNVMPEDFTFQQVILHTQNLANWFQTSNSFMFSKSMMRIIEKQMKPQPPKLGDYKLRGSGCKSSTFLKWLRNLVNEDWRDSLDK